MLLFQQKLFPCSSIPEEVKQFFSCQLLPPLFFGYKIFLAAFQHTRMPSYFSPIHLYCIINTPPKMKNEKTNQEFSAETLSTKAPIASGNEAYINSPTPGIMDSPMSNWSINTDQSGREEEEMNMVFILV